MRIRSDDAYRTFKLKLNPVLERGDFESKEEEDAFVDYYTRFSLRTGPQQKFYSEQKSLPALRKEMHDNLVMSDRHTPKRVHDRLNELVSSSWATWPTIAIRWTTAGRLRPRPGSTPC